VWTLYPDSFASYLNQHPPATTIPGLMNNSKVICRQRRNSLRRLLFPHHMQYFTYDIDLLRQALPVFSLQLADAMQNFYGTRAVQRARLVGKGVCFIHYRIGDFINAGVYISPSSVIAAVQSFPVRPQRIVWMDGGKNFTTKKAPLKEQIIKGDRVKATIMDGLIELGYEVTEGTADFPRLASNGVDSDFLLGSSGEFLVTGLGSFAITLAAASTQHVRFPAVDIFNPNDCTPKPLQRTKLVSRKEGYSFETYDVNIEVF
jgi:hypothetical protein